VLPSAERLRRSSVFQRAYTGRKSIPSDLFTLYILPRTHQKRKGEGSESERPQRLPLVGFVVSKKTCKNASDRNRAKRRVREAYRLLRTGAYKTNKTEDAEENSLYDVMSSLSQWYALVWVLNETVISATWQEICKRMEGCLSEAARKFGQKQS
jgi:ribonuclease P protein component